MTTTTTLTIARQDNSPASSIPMDCKEATQFFGAIKEPIKKGTKLLRTYPVSNGFMVKQLNRNSQTTDRRRPPQYGAYSIEESTGVASLVQRHPNRFRISLTLSWVLWFIYFAGRLNWVRNVQSSVGYQCSIWAILIAETFLAVHELFFSLNILIPLFTRFRKSLRPRQLLVGKQVPSVDVCITCCGEPTDVVLNTIAAAAAQNYPTNKFRVFVLDDGHSMALRTAVQALGARLRQKGGPEILYRSRIIKQGEHSYFKAGNLRFGIQEAKKVGCSEYFASLDADMITEPDWLRKMLPYLLADPQIALVNPPQNYYNAPNGDPLAQQTDLDVFFNLYEPLNDAMNAARCMGSGFVARHTALTAIGGWPLIDVGEDFMLSSCFHWAGWKTAYVGEKVQWGLAPESLCTHLKQKKRWVEGATEVHKIFLFYLWSPQCRMMWTQKCIYLLQALQEYSPILVSVAMSILPAAMLALPIFTDNTFSTCGPWYSRYLFIAAFLASKFNHYLVHGHFGLQRVAKLNARDIWCAPYAALHCLHSLVPNCSRYIFKPSGSITSTVNERSQHLRAPFLQRMLTRGLALPTVYVTYTALPFLFYVNSLQHSIRNSIQLPSLPPGPTLALLGFLMGSLTPLWYMAFPPTVPDWRQLTEVDSKGIRRPKHKGASDHERSNKVCISDALELGVLAICLAV